MSTITGISAAESATDTTRSTGPKALGQDDFLKLLVTQLKQQDPLNPTNNTEFVAQLAQFSQLEQNVKQAQLMQRSLDTQAASFQFTLLPMVGHRVGLDMPLVQVGAGPATIRYALDKDAARVSINILDQQGQVIRTLEYAGRPSGLNVAEWDGKNQNGTLMPAGVYRYALSAIDAQGASVTSQGRAQLTVSGIRMEEGAAKLVVGDLTVNPSDVVELQ
ncbi:MAG: flagellar hook assembly protein FlgD [Nitrospira sp.]|nr:flagellar hook assembly protein FlgD [Nitrospira sp.]